MTSMNLSPEEWAKEFKNFINAADMSPPQELSHQILTKIRSDLNPIIWLVAAKLSFIHLIVGTLTLLFCPQFGFHLGRDMGLMGLLIQYGDQVCMLGCGAIFMSGSALTASLVLRSEEVQKIRRTKILLFPTLGLFSLGAFICIGNTMVLSLAFFWFIGSLVGGLATLELGWMIRRKYNLPFHNQCF